jgi:hypothetical protein
MHPYTKDMVLILSSTDLEFHHYFNRLWSNGEK